MPHIASDSSDQSDPKPQKPLTKPYPPNEDQTFVSPAQESLFNILRDHRSVAPNLAVCSTTLEQLNILGHFTSLMERSGFSNLGILNNSTHLLLVLEFFSSLVVRKDEAGNVTEWCYHIGNETFIKDKATLCEIFGFPTIATVPRYSDHERKIFWGVITRNEVFHQGDDPRKINMKVWDFVHTFITTNVQRRGVAETRVFKRDLDVMIGLSCGEIIDFFTLISENFKEQAEYRHRDNILGGGAYIAALALYDGFTFHGARQNKRKFDLRELNRRGLVRLEPREWVWNPSDIVPESDPEEEEEEEEVGMFTDYNPETQPFEFTTSDPDCPPFIPSDDDEVSSAPGFH